MRALVNTSPLSGQAPQLLCVPDPVPGAGEVLVRLQFAALNHRDLLWLDSEWGRVAFEPTSAFVMGSDGAGVVAGVGPGVSGWSLGDAVLLDPLLSCGGCEQCRMGRVLWCPQLSVLGGPSNGTLAELLVVPAANVHRIPAHLSAEQAAALPMALGTAYNSLFVAGRLRAGETVLVHGVGGGVAQVGLQLAVAAGATVIATSSDTVKLDRARQLGAAYTLDSRRDDLVASVREIVGAHGVDLVLDGVGGPALLTSLEVVAPEGYGRVVRFGSAARQRVDVPGGLLSGKSVVVGGMARPQEMADAVAFVAGHRLVPLLDKPVPLGDWEAAVGLLERGGQNGKLVLEVG